MSGVGPVTGSSVYFALGSPARDRDLELARAWLDGIVAAAGHPSVAMGAALSPSSLGVRLLDGHFANPQFLDPATKPLELTAAGIAATRRMPGHTLVLVAAREAGAMVLRGIPGGASAARLSKAQLDRFEVQLWLFVQPIEADKLGAMTDEMGLWMLLNVLRFGIQNIYLCGVESSGDLSGLAGALKDLTNCNVYWNDDPVHLEFSSTPVTETPPNGLPTRTLTRVYVRTSTGAVATGKPFVGTTDVPLEARPGEFLPGAQKMVGP